MEEWKDIKGYEGLYQVSNIGRIKSNSRAILRKNKRILRIKERIIKLQLNKDNGYYYVGLHNEGIMQIKPVHRLVAETFIPNPTNLPCVDHINGEKTDNRVENLKWCTFKENSNNPLTREYMKNTVWASEERNMKISLLNKGKVVSDETKKKLSIAKKGINLGIKRPEHSALMKLAKRDNFGRFVKKREV